MNNELLISIQSAGWLNPMLEEGKLTEAFEMVKACGIEALDFNFDTKLNYHMVNRFEKGDFYTKSLDEIIEYLKPIKEAADAAGIKFAQAHSPFPNYFSENPEFTEYLLDVTEKCIAACAFLECPAIVVHPLCYVDREEALDVNLKLYRRIMPTAKKYGIKICLENIWFYYNGRITAIDCSDARRAAALVDRLNEEAGEEIFGFCFDIGHATLLDTNVYEFLCIMGNRITALHLHDNDGISDQHLAPMTQRKTDWDGLVLGLREIGYRGSLDFETANSIGNYPRELWDAMFEYTASVGKYLRGKVLAK